MSKQEKPISSLDDLKTKYEGEHNQHPFLLVDLAGGNENLHTNVLGAVLSFNMYSFLESFLMEVIHLPVSGVLKYRDAISVKTQKPALGLKESKPGFIDLYIECKDSNTGAIHKIVIENKIKGAGDTDRQMLRYIASIKEDSLIGKNNAFLDWRDKLKDQKDTVKEQCRNCHFVYLSLDGTDPGEDSLPRFLYNEKAPIINYYNMNYQDDILPWLKDVVLQGCPYSDNGITIAGLRQYIASLERLVQTNVQVSSSVKQYVEGIEGRDSKKYNRLLQEMKLLRKAATQDNMSLWRELKQTAENIYSEGAVDSPWILHFTPSFFVLYKPEWKTIGRWTYSIPFVHLCAANKISSVNNPKKPIKITWEIHLEHYSLDGERPGTVKYVNHGKTAIIKLPDTKSVTLDDREDAGSRKSYFKDILEKASKQIDVIDQSIKEVLEDKDTLKEDKSIGTALLLKIAGRLP